MYSAEQIRKDVEQALLTDENPEPLACKYFGCGRNLTLREAMFGNYCIVHSTPGKLVNKVRCMPCKYLLTFNHKQ
jgi:hypothetical protein